MATKRILISLAILALCSMGASAEDKWGGYIPDSLATGVPLCLDNGHGNPNHPKDRHAPANFPQLAYEGNTFVLAVPYALEDVTIVVRDMDGAVLYYDVVPSITDYYMFLLSDDILADAFSVELYYGDRHLYGEL